MGLLLCMFAVAGLAYLYMDKAKSVENASPTQAETQEAEQPEVESAPEPKPKPKRRSTRKATPKKRTTREIKKAPSSATPALPSGDFEVTFISMTAKASILCGDGQSGSFVGRTRRKFSSITTCRVDIGDAKGAIQVRGPGTMTCSVVGADVRCVGP